MAPMGKPMAVPRSHAFQDLAQSLRVIRGEDGTDAGAEPSACVGTLWRDFRRGEPLAGHVPKVCDGAKQRRLAGAVGAGEEDEALVLIAPFVVKVELTRATVGADVAEVDAADFHISGFINARRVWWRG